MCLDLRNSYFTNQTEVYEFINHEKLNLFDPKDQEKIKRFGFNKKLLQQWRGIKDLGI